MEHFFEDVVNSENGVLQSAEEVSEEMLSIGTTTTWDIWSRQKTARAGIWEYVHRANPPAVYAWASSRGAAGHGFDAGRFMQSRRAASKSSAGAPLLT